MLDKKISFNDLPNELGSVQHKLDLILDRLSNLELVREESLPKYGGMDLAVKITGYSPSSIYRLVAENKIPHKKPRGRLIFPTDELFKWVEDPEK